MISYHFLCDDYIPDIDIPVRFSMDKTLLQRGKTLNDMCVQTGLRILNGRTMGDFSGKYTCHITNGSSVVDYCIVSEQLLREVLFFNVHKFLPDLSDHCLISVLLNINCKIQKEEDNFVESPLKYKWEELSSEKFQLALSSKDLQDRINSFTTHNYDNDTDLMVTDFNNILQEAADRSLKKIPKNKVSKLKTDSNIKKKNSYFDLSLQKMRKDLYDKRNLFIQNNKDPIIRGAFFSHLKLYRKTRKRKERLYRKQIIDKLDNLHENNPNAYWSLLKEISGTNVAPSVGNISGNEWFNYFKKLSCKSNENDKNFREIKESLMELEKEKIFTELDVKISNKEIGKAISSLKNKKVQWF